MSGTIYTIGHSTHPMDEFIRLLSSHKIEVVADIRLLPGSNRYPHFNAGALNDALTSHGIKYEHFPELGGRRRPRKDSKNTAWRVAAFKGYADYMETPEFANGIERLLCLADTKVTAYMCSEAVWWSCHRSLVSDFLKVRGWKVLHIMGTGPAKEHPYTKAARIVEGRLDYSSPDLFSDPE